MRLAMYTAINIPVDLDKLLDGSLLCLLQDIQVVVIH